MSREIILIEFASRHVLSHMCVSSSIRHSKNYFVPIAASAAIGFANDQKTYLHFEMFAEMIGGYGLKTSFLTLSSSTVLESML